MSRTPAYQLWVGGANITGSVQGRLIDLSLTDCNGTDSDSLEFTLSDHDGALAIPKKGAKVALMLGWKDGELIPKGTFIVDEAEHSGAPDKISVRARAANFRENFKEKKFEGHHDTTLGKVLKKIAGRNGLSAVVSPKLASIKIPHIDQAGESDVHFLTRLGHHHDATASVKDGKLIFKPKADGKTVSGAPLPVAIITRADGDNHRYVEQDRDGNQTGARARYHDKKTATEKEEIAGSKENPSQIRGVYPDKDKAKQAAEGEWKRVRRGKANFSVTLAYGRPELIVEQPVVLIGWKPQICAWPWVIEKLTHNLGDNGLTTTVDLETKV